MAGEVIWLLAHNALGASLALSAGAQASFGAGSDVGEAGLGHEISVGWRLPDRRLLLEGVTTSAVGQRQLTAQGGVRYYLTPPYSPQGALSFSASAGVDLAAIHPVIMLGGAVDLPLHGRWTTRVSAGWLAEGGDGGSAARASVSILVPPRRLVAVLNNPATPAAPQQSQPEALDLSGLPADALVWVPHPICKWMTRAEAEAAMASLHEPLADGAELTVAMPGFVSEYIEPEGAPTVALAPLTEPVDLIPSTEPVVPGARVPPAGALLVLAHPGDQVRVNGHDLRVGEDGVAMARVAQGSVDIDVLAGGQAQHYEARIAGNHAVWVRAKLPAPTRILFEQNSAALSQDGQFAIREIANNARSWSFVLQGAYSAEGTLNYNNQLARQRARVVGDALLAAGVAEDRVTYLDPPPADPNKDPSTQRACNILAAPPERGP